MKRIIFFAALSGLAMLAAGCAGGTPQAAVGDVVFENSELKITKIEPNAWVGETSDNTTLYIVEGSERAALIDTGTRIAGLDSIVRGITAKPLTVILTHLHGDHAGNIGYFDHIHFHPADTVLMARARRPYTGQVSFAAEGDVFDLGDTRLEVLHTPGHTPGGISLLDRAAGIIYSGDAVGSNDVWLHLEPAAPIATYITTCEKILAQMDTGLQKIYCGHYVYIDGGVLRRDYVQTMKDLALGLQDGSALAGAVPYDNAAYRDSPNKPLVVSRDGANIVFRPEFLH